MAEGEQPLSGEVDSYVLRRGFAASARLNLLHHLWQHMSGPLLDPKITETFSPETARIAEICTGTGIWLMDLAKTLPPTAQLDGFDISLDQCPPPGFRPDNVTFTELDAFASVPQDLVGKYDAVYIRHFVLVVDNEDPSRVIENIMTMLKPGGYLQWCEFDWEVVRFQRGGPDSSTKAIEKLYNYIFDTETTKGQTIRTHSHWPAKLHLWLKKMGMQNVSEDRMRFDKPYLFYYFEQMLLTWEELTLQTIEPRSQEQGQVARGLLADAYKESRAGAVFDVERLVTIAQKPL